MSSSGEIHLSVIITAHSALAVPIGSSALRPDTRVCVERLGIGREHGYLELAFPPRSIACRRAHQPPLDGNDSAVTTDKPQLFAGGHFAAAQIAGDPKTTVVVEFLVDLQHSKVELATFTIADVIHVAALATKEVLRLGHEGRLPWHETRGKPRPDRQIGSVCCRSLEASGILWAELGDLPTCGDQRVQDSRARHG